MSLPEHQEMEEPKAPMPMGSQSVLELVASSEDLLNALDEESISDTLPESKSMDTILLDLDASGFELPSVDLTEESNGKVTDDTADVGETSVTDDDDPPIEIPPKWEGSEQEMTTTFDNSTGPANVTESEDVKEISDVTSTPMKTQQTSTLSQYFSSSTGGGGDMDLGGQSTAETSGVEFFDSFSVPTEPEQKPEPDKPQTAESEKAGKKRGVMFEDVVPVDFEEEKGSGLALTGSIKNLNKYFTEAEAEQDDEAKVFFESFTAAKTEEDAVPGTRTRTESSSSQGAVPKLGPTKQTTPFASPAHTQRFNSQSSHESVPGDLYSVKGNDAWLAPENVKAAIKMALQNKNTSSGVVSMPESLVLTMPGVISDQLLGDPVYDLVLQFIGEPEAAKRSTFTADDVTQDDNGLRQLIGAECWRAAVDLTTRLLTEEGQGPGKVGLPSQNTPRTLQLWFTRIALLIKLKMFGHAEAEMEAFGNFERPDLYYEFYGDQYPDRQGSFVPYSFRLLQAELPQYQGRVQESLDRLYHLHGVVKQILGNLTAGLTENGCDKKLSTKSRDTSLKVWTAREVRTLHAVGDCLMRIKDYRSAVKVYEDLIPKSGSSKESLLCGIGRIHLQMGNVTKAEELFQMAETNTDSGKSAVKRHDKLNRGFAALGLTQCHEAYKHFQQAQVDMPDSAAAVNNMAVCLLYTCKLREALDALEGLVHRDPFQFLQEGILFNLCTLYELESSHAVAKKQALLDLVSKYKGNGFNTSCLKMS